MALLPAQVHWNDVLVIAGAIACRVAIPAVFGFVIGALGRKRPDLLWMLVPVWVWWRLYLAVAADSSRLAGIELWVVGYLWPLGALIGTVGMCMSLKNRTQ